MRAQRHWQTPALLASAFLWVGAGLGCVSNGSNVPIQWDATEQIYQSEGTQVQVRNAQSRTYDTTDKVAMLEAIVATYQDLGFQVEVLDEKLGIVSGKKFLDLSQLRGSDVASYMLYDEDSLVVFNKAFRTWGPFKRRADLVRLTATVRQRNARQLIVRASAQFYLRPVEDPAAYQSFYSALEKALFVERDAAQAGS